MANVTKSRMNSRTGIAISAAINASALTVFGLLGFSLGYQMEYPIWGLSFGWATWIAIRIGNDFRVIPKQEYRVVERFGQLYRVAHSGPRLFLLLGLIDKYAKNGAGTLAYQRFEIYKGESEKEDDKKAEIDFRDASAPVTATVWYAVAQQKLKEAWESDWSDINEQIIAWTYAFDDPMQRLFELVDGFVRPRLQELTLDEAQVETTKDPQNQSMSKLLLKDRDIKRAMAELGAEFDPNKPFVLSDVAVPEELQKVRSERLVASARADADKETGRGVSEAIDQIATSLEGDKAAALAAFQTRVAQEVVKNKPGDVQFIASDVGGLTRTLEVAPKQKGDKNE
ncbi:MAG: hypothetical protein R3B69_03645 [Candidatus Paceibacterota bacterium]